MPHVTTPDGTRLYYEEVGTGSPVVFVHEYAGDYRTWEPQLRYFSRSHRCITLSQRGYPPSDVPTDPARYGQDIARDDIIAILDALGIDKAHVVGHSMGARFAVRSAVLHPAGVERLVLIDPPVSGPGRREYPSKLPWYVDSIRQSLLGMDAEAMRAFCATWSVEQLQLRAEWLHTCYEPAIVRAFNDFHDVDFHQDLPRLEAPALLMIAGRGGVITAEDEAEILALQPNIRTVHVENAGHMIPWDDLEGFFNAFGDFLGPRL